MSSTARTRKLLPWHACIIGAGGWAYFEVPGQHPLLAYSKAFNFVEVNSTFYEIPSLKLVQSWRGLVPPNFEFAVRCNKALTHKHKFQPTPEAYEVLKRMITICSTLKTDILHLQTPPTFQQTKTNAELIRNFFSATDPKGIRIALEIRGAKGEPNPDLIKTMLDYNMIIASTSPKKRNQPTNPTSYTQDSSEKAITTSTSQQMKNLEKSTAKRPKETTKQ